jgi:hypothetical protein
MPPQLGVVARKVARSLRHPLEELGAAALVGAGAGFVAGAALVLALHFTERAGGWRASSGGAVL